MFSRVQLQSEIMDYSVKHYKRNNLMKQLSRSVIYQRTDRSVSDKTSETQLTEYQVCESIYTLINTRPKKNIKNYYNNGLTKSKKLGLYNINSQLNPNKSLKKKINLRAKSKKLQKRSHKKEKSTRGKMQSLELFLANMGTDRENHNYDDIHWSIKSVIESSVKEKDNRDIIVQPVAIVPPLPLPISTKVMEDNPQPVTLRRTPSVMYSSEHHPTKPKVIMKGRPKYGFRKPKPSIITAETLARALTSQKWTRGPRQVPIATFKGTRIHYRYLIAKYGRQKIVHQHQKRECNVYGNKSNVHSNFSIINLLHEVEEAISQNKFSRETDRKVKNFKEELNRDLLYAEPLSGKYNRNNRNSMKKYTKRSSFIGHQGLSETESENETEDIVIDSKKVINNFFGNKQRETLDSQDKKLLIDPFTTSIDSNINTFKLFKHGDSLTELSSKIEIRNEDTEVSNYPVLRFVTKDKKILKKKKESKVEDISEEERVNAVMLELKKQLKISEAPTPFLLAKGDSLTELNFEKEPSTCLSIDGSLTSLGPVDLFDDEYDGHSEHQCNKELSDDSNSIKEHSLSPNKRKHFRKSKLPSSSKSYAFRIDYDSIKDKPSNIYNIVSALDGINQFLKNIPVQYDKNTGQSYIMYDPKTIINMSKDKNSTNVSQDYRLVVKKCNKKTKPDYTETDRSLSDTRIKISKKSELEGSNNILQSNEEVGTQLVNSVKEQFLKNKPGANITTHSKKGECNDKNNTNSEREKFFHHKSFEYYPTLITNELANKLNYENTIKKHQSPIENLAIFFLWKYSFLMKEVAMNYQIAVKYCQAVTYYTYYVFQDPDYIKESKQYDLCNRKKDGGLRKESFIPKKNFGEKNIYDDIITTSYKKAIYRTFSHQDYDKIKRDSDYYGNIAYLTSGNDLGLNSKCELGENYDINTISNTKFECDKGNMQQYNIMNKNFDESSFSIYKQSNKIMSYEGPTQSCIQGVDQSKFTFSVKFDNHNLSGEEVIRKYANLNQHNLEEHNKNNYKLNKIGFRNQSHNIHHQDDSRTYSNTQTEFSTKHSYNTSFITDFFRSASINTMQNIPPQRKDAMKPVFCFQTTQQVKIPNFKSNKQFLTPSHDIFSKYVYHYQLNITKYIDLTI